ncbi:MAG: AMP-binding protein [Candidatus Omnitrophota bacterium]|nr:MAG: AMP-binding protein [Candidatus Omnitrophota bacterium]
MNVKELLKEQARYHPNKTAIIFEDTHTSFTQLRDSSFRFANYLIDSGIGKGDKIALFLPNILEAVFAQLGALSMGAVLVPLDFMLTEEEIVNFINHSESKILVIQPKKEVSVENVKTRCPTLERIVVCKESGENLVSLSQIMDRSSSSEPSLDITHLDISSLFYTSGSTGHPKGVVLTYKHLENPPKTLDYFLKGSTDDIYLCGGVPFSHIAGLDFILMMIYFGSTLVLMERFQPLEFIRNIERYRVTIFCIVPAMFVAILSLKEYDKFDFSSLRYAVVFGAPSSPMLLKRFHKAYPGATMLNGWGMTETAAPNTYSPPDESKISSIGPFGFNMEAKIVNEQGCCVARGQRGELWVRGEPVMVGYYKEDALTKEVLTEDRWLKTGDIAILDENGLFYIVGRKKDMIKVAGEIVFSPEVEEKIYRHPKVKEVAVIGVPDALRGEVPKAFIVADQTQTLGVEELEQFLKEHLAHFKIPHHFEFLPNLPKNRTGKIDKTKLS